LRISRGVLRVSVVCVLALALAIPMAALTNSFVAKASAETESVLRIGFMQKIDSMNPNVGLVDASYVFYGLVYDAPMCVDNDLGIAGNLCTDWYVDESYEPYGSAWIWELTEHAYWHDGERLTADDVVFTINLNAGNYTTMWAYQPYAYYMH
jgi:ABC-type transport system substrate-binding protein